jgi:hypothetical protein
MAFRQSPEAATGAVRGAITASQPTVVLVDYTIPAGVLVNDITEMGAIPHGCRVIDTNVFSDGLGTNCTVDVGTLSGVYAKNDEARTMGNEFYAGVAVAAAGLAPRATKNPGAFTAKESATGFGVKFLGAVPTAGKKLTVVLPCVRK